MTSVNSLDQRCGVFRKKVEQRLMLADTEIQQLNDYLLSLKAQFTELTDQKTRIDNQIQQNIELKEGLKKKKRIEDQARLAQLDSVFQQQIKQLQNTQAHTIEALQADFEASLTKIQQCDAKQMKKLNKQYDIQITELEKQLEKAEEDATYVDKTAKADANDEIESSKVMEDQIQQLQDLYIQKQEERAHSLYVAKEQLVECVRALEQNEEEHRLKLEDLKEKLRSDEEEYYQQVQQIKDTYKRQIPPLKKQVRLKEAQFKEIQKQIQYFKTNNDAKLQPLVNKSERVKETLFRVTKAVKIQQERDTKLIEAQSRVANLKLRIRERESVMQRELDLNNELKQKVCRLQFLKKTKQRREALNI